MDRVILHSDLNCFYASVEMLLNPALRGKAVAVCGPVELRHGIVLAKSESAKRAGVKTGMAVWEAKRHCPDLIVVPPQHRKYLEFSRLVREIYERFTDYVEPFGLDECWLDVTKGRVQGTGEELAQKLRRLVKSELGLTVSVGVSFNKVFAKLGSDLKKPDAVSVISRENFREQLWDLPVGNLLYVGKATEGALKRFGITTIGRLAQTEERFLKERFGVNGSQLWRYANGLDEVPVRHKDDYEPPKSLGHGVTCSRDLRTEEEVRKVFFSLAESVGRRLRKHGMEARGVQISVKGASLQVKQMQAPLRGPTQSGYVLAQAGISLFCKHYAWQENVRALSLTAIHLAAAGSAFQPDLFFEPQSEEKRVRLEKTVDSIREKFGADSIRAATLFCVEEVAESEKDP